MWDAHAEVPKSLLKAAADIIEAHESAGMASLRLWWIMASGEQELAGEPFPDNAPILGFMGSGASHCVSAAELRQAFPGTEIGFSQPADPNPKA